MSLEDHEILFLTIILLFSAQVPILPVPLRERVPAGETHSQHTL